MSVQELMRQYMQSLPEKCATLNRLREPEQRQELRAFVHKLAGSTGIYGLNKAAQQARALLDASQQSNGDEIKIQQLLKELVVELESVYAKFIQ